MFEANRRPVPLFVAVLQPSPQSAAVERINSVLAELDYEQADSVLLFVRQRHDLMVLYLPLLAVVLGRFVLSGDGRAGCDVLRFDKSAPAVGQREHEIGAGLLEWHHRNLSAHRHRVHPIVHPIPRANQPGLERTIEGHPRILLERLAVGVAGHAVLRWGSVELDHCVTTSSDLTCRARLLSKQMTSCSSRRRKSASM